ncbi:unnamed protein product [Microthlaspi erraticum]|uniref:Formin-like protein n=1 Tax=Microthlaspi erraticum TaxID=1685480 RepID=A0A6D2J5J4_9BRAS|nr:unnamed protein product [Microthlaspi erraticum]
MPVLGVFVEMHMEDHGIIITPTGQQVHKPLKLSYWSLVLIPRIYVERADKGGDHGGDPDSKKQLSTSNANKWLDKMALFRKLFYRKPPVGLLEICDRVYVFDCCFSSNSLEKEDYKVYIAGVVSQLREHFPDASSLVFNFREVGTPSVIDDVLSEHDLTIMDYPRHHEGCSLLPVEMMHHFLRSSESWLSLGPSNLLLMHCERGAWPVLAFTLAALLIYQKQYTGEYKTLDMMYKQAPRELLHLFSPLNPIPSQLRYLKYVSGRHLFSEWPPLDRALTMDCVILRFIPDVGGQGGCRPIFRVYGQDPNFVDDRKSKLLYLTPKKGKHLRIYNQAECELVKIDINCHVQGDIVIECLSLNDDMEREAMLFRVAFNTAFVRSNNLILNHDEVDTLWHLKEQFPKGFKVELLFSDMVAAELMDLAIANTTTQDAPELLGQESPSATVKPLVENYDQENILKSPSQESNGKSVSLLSPPPHPVRILLPPSPSPLPIVASQTSEKLQHFVVQPVETLSQGNSWVSLAGSTLYRTTPNEKLPMTLPTTSPPLLPASHESLQEFSKTTNSSSVLPSPALSITLAKPSQTETLGSFSPLTPPLTGALGNPVRSPPSVSNSHRTDALPPPPPPPVQHSNQNTVTRPPPPPPPPPPTPPVSNSHRTDAVPRPPPPPVQHSNQNTVTRPPPPPPPPPPTPPVSNSHRTDAVPRPPPPPVQHSNQNTVTRPPPPPPPPPPTPPVSNSHRTDAVPRPPPPPPPPPTPPPVQHSNQNTVTRPPPPPPPPPPVQHSNQNTVARPPPPPPPPPPMQLSNQNTVARPPPLIPPPPPAPAIHASPTPPPPPAPPTPQSHGNSATKISPPTPPRLPTSSASPRPPTGPPPPPVGLDRKLPVRPTPKPVVATVKLKPFYWLKLTKAVTGSGSIWDETPMSGGAFKAPDINRAQLQICFTAVDPVRPVIKKPVEVKKIIRLIDGKRAQNCEIMLSNVKVPLQDLMNSVLNLDESALDADKVENLNKFCPTTDEMSKLKAYDGDKNMLGKCELFFLEMMKVPRVDKKLRAFSFKIQFSSQISQLRDSLNVVHSTAEQIKNSEKLKRIMQTVLAIGNALNQGTNRGNAVGFKLDSLPKLSETRSSNFHKNLMHYLCWILSEEIPEVLDFSEDLFSLEPATKIQLKFLADEMQAINKGLGNVVEELSSSEEDGPISSNFNKIVKEFLHHAEAEVRSLASFFAEVGRNVDGLIRYFGEDPAKCHFEKVVSTLLSFVRLFNRAHEENRKQVEAEAKKNAEKEKTETM